MALPAQFVNAAAITTSDTAANEFDAIYVGVTGNVAVVTRGGQTVTFLNAQQGSTLYIKTQRVNATSTTATNLIGLR